MVLSHRAAISYQLLTSSHYHTFTISAFDEVSY